jgi:cytidylate kinase
MATYDHRNVVAIDGPGAAGKSTVAVEVAAALDAVMFDTGALYRVITLLAHRSGVAIDDEAALVAVARSNPIDLRAASVEDGRTSDVLVADEDVTWEIRSPAIDAHVSAVAALPGVRESLLAVQREIADDKRAVLVGRDIGTVVIPDAGLKIFLDASVEERARRRFNDMRSQGEDTTFSAVLEDLQCRDTGDSERATSPLRRAADAVVILTDGRDIEDIVQEIATLAKEHGIDADEVV